MQFSADEVLRVLGMAFLIVLALFVLMYTHEAIYYRGGGNDG